MSTGRNNKLTGQVGEHLVSAILGTKGYYATPYSGNVPGFDVTAVNAETLKSFPIQVKTSNGGALFRSTITKWADLLINDKKETQKLVDKLPLQHPDIIWVIVSIENNDIASARFFICTEKEIQTRIYNHYEKYLKKHGGKRPRNYESTLVALTEEDLVDLENNWRIIETI